MLKFHPRARATVLGPISLAIAALLLTSVQAPAEQHGIPIELVQREFQARFNYLTAGNYTLWPACRSGLPAPLYPPGGFYGDLTGDPGFAAYLVGDLCSQFYAGYYPLYSIGNDQFDDNGGRWLGIGPWVKTGDITGSFAGPPAYSYSDFPSTDNATYDLLNVTPQNYGACFAQVKRYVEELIYTSGYSSLGAVDTTNGLDLGSGSYSTTSGCQAAEDGAKANFSFWDQNVNNYPPQATIYGESATANGVTTCGADNSAVRARTYYTATFVPGTVTMFIALTNYPGSPDGGVCNPVSVDGTFYRIESLSLNGYSLAGGTNIGDCNPTINCGCPNINGNPPVHGWILTGYHDIFQPQFDISADTVPLCGDDAGSGGFTGTGAGSGSGGSCGTCQSGGCKVPGAVVVASGTLDVRVLATIS